MNIVDKISQSVRYRLGMAVASSELEKGTDESVAKFYNDRITECTFLDDPSHYEYPRSQWVLENVSGGSLLEIGCGNGGMTRLLAPKVKSLTAFDVSEKSLELVNQLELSNVETSQGLIENFTSEKEFDWIVLSEVIEHLRKPTDAVLSAFKWLAPNGTLLITTPNGHWESDEHLHEFSLKTFSQLLAQTNCESFKAEYLRDRTNRRRWLTAKLNRAEISDTPNDFFDRKAIAKQRRNK